MRESFGSNSGRLMAHQIFALQIEQPRILALCLAPPGIELGTVAQTLGDDLIVEGEYQLIVHQHVRTPRFVLERFNVEHQLVVVREELPAPGILFGNFPGNQPLADEDFARLLRIQRTEIHALLRIDDNAVERRSLEGDDLHRLLFPMRIEPAALDQVRTDRLQPLRFDARHAAGEELGRFGDFSSGDPLAGFLVERRAGMDQELHPARAKVVCRILRLAADIAQQAGEQCAVDRLVGGWNLILLPVVFGCEAMQLLVDVAPLAHAQSREKVFVASLNQLALRFLVFYRALVPIPQLEPGKEFGFLVGKLLVCGVGRSLAFLRPLARILNGQCGGDHQHLAQTALFSRGNDHARHARIKRHLRQLLPDRCQRAIVSHRAKFEQELVAVTDCLGRRCFDERETLDIADAQSLHAQDHACQRGAKNLRIGIRRTQAELLLVIQANANAGGDAPASAGTLVGRRLGDLLDLQLLDLVAVGIALDPRQPRIDNETDARHGQRGFGNVGRQHNSAPGMRLEDSRLLLGRQTGEERQDFRMRRVVFSECFGRLANLAFARQENQHVAAVINATTSAQFVASIYDGVVEIALAFLFRLFVLHRTITNFDRIHAARNLDHRSIVEVLRKALGIDRCRRDDELQIGTPGQQLLDIAEQKIDVQAALVRLVENQGVILPEPWVALRFGQQYAVGHQLDVGIFRGAVGKTDLVADQRAELAVQFLRNPRRGGAGGDATRLRMTDQAGNSPAQFKTYLGDLRRLARTRFTADDHYRMLFDQRGNLATAGIDRQIVGELGFGQTDTTDQDGRTRFLKKPVVFGLQIVALLAEGVAHVARHGAQTSLVDGQAVRVVGFTFQLMEEQQGRRSTGSGNRSAFPARMG